MGSGLDAFTGTLSSPRRGEPRCSLWPLPSLRLHTTGAWLAGSPYLLGLVKAPVVPHGAGGISMPSPVFHSESLTQGLTHFSVGASLQVAPPLGLFPLFN